MPPSSAPRQLAGALGEPAGARRARDAGASGCEQRFEAAFWSRSSGPTRFALDGAKRPCRVRSSNAGHALFAGIAAPERAARVAEALMTTEFFSGWGIRTIADGEARYNPMSYHNGSVWPHDNALIALGFARYGLTSPLLRVLDRLVRCGAGFRAAPPAGAVLRLPAAQGGGRRLSRGLRAAGVVGGLGLRAARRRARHLVRARERTDPLHPSGAAGLARRSG